MSVATADSTHLSSRDQSLQAEELHKMNAYWRAANYLSVGQIYLYENPLLREPLKLENTKPRLLGHFGTTPGLNFIYVHLNRVIKKHDLNVIYICGPGHGGPGMVAWVIPRVAFVSTLIVSVLISTSFPCAAITSRPVSPSSLSPNPHRVRRYRR